MNNTNEGIPSQSKQRLIEAIVKEAGTTLYYYTMNKHEYEDCGCEEAALDAVRKKLLSWSDEKLQHFLDFLKEDKITQFFTHKCCIKCGKPMVEKHRRYDRSVDMMVTTLYCPQHPDQEIGLVDE